MQGYGLQVHDVSPEVEAEWLRVATEGTETLIGTAIPAEILDRVIKYRDEFRAQP